MKAKEMTYQEGRARFTRATNIVLSRIKKMQKDYPNNPFTAEWALPRIVDNMTNTCSIFTQYGKSEKRFTRYGVLQITKSILETTRFCRSTLEERD